MNDFRFTLVKNEPVAEDVATLDEVPYKVFVREVEGGYTFTYHGGPSGHEDYCQADGTPFPTIEAAINAAKNEDLEVQECIVTDAVMRKSADGRDIEVFPYMSGFAFSPYGTPGICLKKGQVPFASIEEAFEAAENPAAYEVINF